MRRLALMTALLMSGSLQSTFGQWPNAQPFSPGSADIVDLASKNGGLRRVSDAWGIAVTAEVSHVLTLHSAAAFVVGNHGGLAAERRRPVFKQLAAPTPRVDG
jgi:hypothetical protein